MTDPAIDAPPEPELVTPHRRGGRIWLVVLGVLLVLGLGYYLLSFAGVPRMHILPTMQEHQAAMADEPSTPIPFDAGRVDALNTEVEQLRQRVDALEHRPVAAPVPAGTPAPGAPIGDATAAALGGRVDALSARFDELADRLRADEARLETAASQASTVAALTERAARLARVQAAEAALAEGLPLGEIPGAPAALARFHSDKPPTEAQLRLQFPAVAAAARAAVRPDTRTLGFWRAMRARLAMLVTIRRGDTVLVGSSQIGIIDQARVELDAGDLADAVTSLGALDGPPAAAMADWVARAKALLEARAALATLAEQS